MAHHTCERLATQTFLEKKRANSIKNQDYLDRKGIKKKEEEKKLRGFFQAILLPFIQLGVG